MIYAQINLDERQNRILDIVKGNSALETRTTQYLTLSIISPRKNWDLS